MSIRFANLLSLAPLFFTLSFQVLAGSSSSPGPAFSSTVADRAAIERVYYNHRLGEKLSFEKTLPPPLLENLVRLDSIKEAVLRQAYGLKVTPEMVHAEIHRIDTSTRAPEILAEIKTALGGDQARFGNAFAKPIIVERLLREKFENDDALHFSQRCEVEQIRSELTNAVAAFYGSQQTFISNPKNARSSSAGDSTILGRPIPAIQLVASLLTILKRNHTNSVIERTWRFGARPTEATASSVDQLEIKKRFGPNAQVLSSPSVAGQVDKFYFEDLSPELQNVLRVQLRRAGDVSAVIEMPSGFLLYVAEERTEAELTVAGLSLTKRNFEQWVQEQGK